MIRTTLFTALLVLSLPASRAAAQDAPAPVTTSSPSVKPPAAPADAPDPSATGLAPSAAAPVVPARAARPDIYDEHADGRMQIDAALARAARNNRRVLIQWGANWCGWCHLLHELCATDGEIRHELLYEYDLVLVDVGHFDKHLDLAAGYGADLKAAGLPYLTLLAADGSVLASQPTSPLELTEAEKAAGGKLGHSPARVLGFLALHEAPALHSQDVWRDALAEAGRQGKRVFLHFGAPWCGWCHKLEDWMAQPRVAELLGRDFVDCKVDTERTLGGEGMLARLRGSDQGGIPWCQLVAADGTVLADSNAGEAGNIGFPSAPHELAHFGEMLRKAAVRLTPGDIDELLASLAPKAKAKAADGPARPAVIPAPAATAEPGSPAAGAH
ncbi:MAG TPA: thioredoxin family protein [Planctomycetota bacterium]|nr:thioredoxin family protein [Planctomycetota bacterium]